MLKTTLLWEECIPFLFLFENLFAKILGTDTMAYQIKLPSAVPLSHVSANFSPGCSTANPAHC